MRNVVILIPNRGETRHDRMIKGSLMDRKQKEQLRILLRARKRAEKVLAERRALQQEKLERNLQKAANQELMQQYGQTFAALAERSGILALAEQAARERNGRMTTKMSYYLDFGIHTSRLHRAVMTYKDGVLRASHLSIFVNWGEGKGRQEVEIRYNKNHAITFHNSHVPVFSFIWKHFPKVLPKMLADAMAHPRPPDATSSYRRR